MKSIKYITILLALIIGTTSISIGQDATEPDVQKRLEMIERGEADAVRRELPSLIQKYPNNAGVLFLQAVLTEDGQEAAKQYQTIVDNHSTSEWADDALYRLYQYYYSIGLYKTADQKLAQLRKEYPYSAYVTGEEPASKAIAEQPKKETEAPKQEQPVKKEPEPPKQEPPTKKEPVKTEAPVKKEPPKQEPPAQKVEPVQPAVQPPAPVSVKKAGKFTVQVGAFAELKNAEDLRAKFEQEGLKTSIFSFTIDGRKIHKVWIGEFGSYDEAKQFTETLKTKYKMVSIVVAR